MKINSIKLKNIINFYQDIEISFIDDFIDDGKYSNSNFEKPFSFDGKRILSKVGIIGKNASGKTTIVKNISLITKIINFDFSKDFFSKMLFSFIDKIFLHIKNKKYKEQKSILNDNHFKDNFDFDIISEFFDSQKNNLDKVWFDCIMKFANNKNKAIEYEISFFDEKTNNNYLLGIEVNPFKPFLTININEDKFEIDFEKALKEKLTNKLINDLNLLIETTKKSNLFKLFNFFEKIINKINFSKEKKMLSSFDNLIFVFDVDYFYKFRKNKMNEFLKYTNKKIKNNDVKDKLLKWIKIADPSIQDLRYDKINNVFNSFIDENNQNVELSYLSDGTWKWFNIYDIVFESPFELIVFDEIENSFHPKLSKTLIDSFYTTNKQLLFTTHNPLIFSKKFRPNAVYFIEDSEEKFKKTLSRLSDEFKIEKKHVISEMIRKETFGTHPNVNDICEFLELIEGNNE